MDVLIRDLPVEVHTELARRAAASDMSLRAYLCQVLSDAATSPDDVSPQHRPPSPAAGWPSGR